MNNYFTSNLMSNSHKRLRSNQYASNNASDNGVGIYNRNTAKLNFVTLVGNSAGAPGTRGNLYMDGEGTSISIHNTIIANGGTAGNCGHLAGVITCNLGNISSAAQVSVQVVTTTTLLGVLTNNASVTSSTADPNAANNSASATTAVNTAIFNFVMVSPFDIRSSCCHCSVAF